ncbi:unnamed protein product [Meloidogyne enterolobii]|uniref:Uncharacterized protein n=1 Tax=Meloidogyne enterolobii TaxID=390850 RepID=A0ACB1B300_MELEN
MPSPPRRVTPPPLATDLPSPPHSTTPTPCATRLPSPPHITPTLLKSLPRIPPANILHSPPLVDTLRPDIPPDNVELEKELQEFYDGLMAATTGITSSPKKLEETEQKKDGTINAPI